MALLAPGSRGIFHFWRFPWAQSRMDKDRLQIISTLLVTVLLILFAGYLARYVPGTTSDNLSVAVTTAVIAKWLQQGAAATAEKFQEAVAKTAANTTTTDTVQVDADVANVTEKP